MNDLKQFGYSDGDYMGRCSDCGCEHIADKRATVCVDCAYRKLADQQAEQIAMLEKAVDTGVEAEEKLKDEIEHLKKLTDGGYCRVCGGFVGELFCDDDFKAATPQKGQDNEMDT